MDESSFARKSTTRSTPDHRRRGWVEEEAVYDYLGYPMGKTGNLASHGSRVMGIAAANGRSVSAYPGVAPEADVVFVQLPDTLIEANPSALTGYILDAINYVFALCARPTINRPSST